MSYDVITPATLDGINREFSIVQNGLRQIGVKISQRALDGSTAFSEITAPDNKYLNFDLSMWDWVGYEDPDFMLSVLTCDQYGALERQRLLQPGLRQALPAAGRDGRPAKRQKIVWQMQKIIADQRPYIMLVNLDVVQASPKKWPASCPFLDGYSKVLWTTPHQVRSSRRASSCRGRLRHQADAVRARHDLRGDHAELHHLPGGCRATRCRT